MISSVQEDLVDAKQKTKTNDAMSREQSKDFFSTIQILMFWTVTCRYENSQHHPIMQPIHETI